MSGGRYVEVPWTLRAQPASERSAEMPSQRVAVRLDPEGYRLFLALRERLYDPAEGKFLLDGDERVEALNELHVLMEMAYFVNAEVLSVEEQAALDGVPVETPETLSPEAVTEGFRAMQELEARGFRIPAKARASMAVGQTSLDSHDSLEPHDSHDSHEAKVPPVRLPYRDRDADPEPEPEPEPEPVEELAAVTTIAHARTTDPATSHAAALSLGDLRDTQSAVLSCLRNYGAMHHEKLIEVYERARVEHGWPRQSVSGIRTRTKELVEGRLVRDSGNSVTLRSRRQSIVWEVVAR